MAKHDVPGQTDEWYTPAHIFDALGERFDLDVSHPGEHRVDWIPAARVLTRDSLGQDWAGFVWMNPPFGGRNGIIPWLDKFFRHGNGIALTPDRVSAPWWNDAAKRADLILVGRGKPSFLDVNLVPRKSPPQGITLMAAGDRACAALRRAGRAGLGLVLTAERWPVAVSPRRRSNGREGLPRIYPSGPSPTR